VNTNTSAVCSTANTSTHLFSVLHFAAILCHSNRTAQCFVKQHVVPSLSRHTATWQPYPRHGDIKAPFRHMTQKVCVQNGVSLIASGNAISFIYSVYNLLCHLLRGLWITFCWSQKRSRAARTKAMPLHVAGNETAAKLI